MQSRWFRQLRVHTIGQSMQLNWLTAYALRAIQSIGIEITSTLFVLPLIIWFTLYLAQPWWSVNSGPALPWLKMLRWIGWAVGVALWLNEIIGKNLDERSA